MGVWEYERCVSVGLSAMWVCVGVFGVCALWECESECDVWVWHVGVAWSDVTTSQCLN